MEEIRKYPVLYDKFGKDFRDKYKKHNAWMNVASTFSTTLQEVEKMYKSIRTSYGRYLRQLNTMPTGLERKAVPSVPEFEHLDWLKVYIERKQTTTNLLPLSPSSGQSDNVHMTVTDDLCDRSITPFPLPTDESGGTVTDIDTDENDSNNEECSKNVISDQKHVQGKKRLFLRKTMII